MISPTEPVSAYLEEHRESLVSDAETLLGYDTSNLPGNTATAATWIASRLEAASVDVERVAVDPEKPNLLPALPDLLAGEPEVTRFEVDSATEMKL
ncbi:hypothetical protein ABNG03_04765 [Halorubrum sp. RMP-47]|uniref:hypothetical protein n=1 Tax=Halorubrum miltondacostae TaxID=3076378 RepID=UPI00352864F7